MPFIRNNSKAFRQPDPGEPDTGLPGDCICQVHGILFNIDRGVSELVDVPVRHAANRRFKWRVRTFPGALGTHHLNPFRLSPGVPVGH